MSTLAWDREQDRELRRSHEQRLESAVLCQPAPAVGRGWGCVECSRTGPDRPVFSADQKAGSLLETKQSHLMNKT